MKRQVPGLAATARDSHSEVPDGMFLVRVDPCPGSLVFPQALMCSGSPFSNPSCLPGSIKGDVKEKTLFLSLEKR